MNECIRGLRSRTARRSCIVPACCSLEWSLIGVGSWLVFAFRVLITDILPSIIPHPQLTVHLSKWPLSIHYLDCLIKSGFERLVLTLKRTHPLTIAPLVPIPAEITCRRGDG